MIPVFIAIGSNLANPLLQVEAALAALANLPHSRLVKTSSFYRTKPLGPQNQPDYLNAVVKLETELAAEQLLDATQAIELNQGRQRKGQRWGARTLDLDLLLYGTQVIHSERLTVPHYDMKNREFMLYPLAEIAPDLHFPDGSTLQAALKKIDRRGLLLWHSPDSGHSP